MQVLLVFVSNSSSRFSGGIFFLLKYMAESAYWYTEKMFDNVELSESRHSGPDPESFFLYVLLP
jgi:hypothetical protein